MERLQLVPVARGLSDFEAKVVTAQLGAEGIIFQLRGADAVYPMGNVDVLVPANELDDARSVLLPPLEGDHGFPVGPAEGDVDDFGTDGLDRLDGRRPYRRRWWFVAVLLAAGSTFFLVRLVTLGVHSPASPSGVCVDHPEALAGGLTASCHD